MFGAGNRSYADPALFRSIEVEKGASLSRGIRSGVGGAVNIRTIEPSDIIPAGKSLGVEVKLEASGNSSKPSIDVNSYFGKDYRDVPGAYRFDGTNVSIPAPPPRNKGGGENFNFDSHSGMVAVAGRNEMVDFLLSYSERRQGNYYAGKRNSRKYAGHDPFDKSTTDSYVPNLTKLYYAGDEVFNTASETKTTLLKNNWYLPNAQKIGFQFMRTDLDFGETTPGDSVLMWAYREGAEQARPDDDWASAPRFVFEKPHSELKVDRYKLDYEIKPEDSDWVNLEASLWHTKTTGTRHQTGIAPFGIDADEKTTKDLEFYDWALDLLGPEAMEGYPVPEHDGTIVSNGRQWTSHDRTGFDLSNQMKLADNLQLIVGGSIQREKLDDRVQRNNRSSNGVLPDGASMHTLTDFLGPRSGKREEYSAMMNLTWQPTEWLTLTAGARYMHYSGKDTGTAKRRAAREEKFAALRRKTGMKLTWGELLTDAERQAIDTLSKNEVDTFVAAQPYISDFYQYGTRTPEVDAWLAAIRAGEEFTNGRSITKNPAGDLLFWKHELIVPIKNGKPDSAQNPFANGELNAAESVEHAQDVDNAPKYTTAVNDYYVYERLDEGKAWEAPPEQSGDAWSPVLSATARITEFGSAFVRYAQTTRFPSIFELTSSSIVDGANTEGTLLIDGASKPERSINWEIGYTHNLTQFFPGMELADARISYYNTEIRNFIDRNRYLDIIQFDKRKTSGIELQSRFDTGRFFGSLGATYRLKQKMCDKDYASSMDPYYNRIPQCMTGGFPDTYGGSSLQPKYSIVMALGSRLMNRRLEMGWRGVYHSGAENKQLDSLLAVNTAPPGLDNLPRDMWFRGGQHTFYWKPVLLHDLYARFEVSKDVLLNLNITNLTDEYYIEPMSKSLLPGPGRTVSAGVTIKF